MQLAYEEGSSWRHEQLRNQTYILFILKFYFLMKCCIIKTAYLLNTIYVLKK